MFLHPGYFPVEKAQPCLNVTESVAQYTPVFSLEEAMYLWWKIYKIQYTYSWSYSSPDVTVSGSGSVIMDGGIKNMSDKVCPQVIYWTCGQTVNYVNNLTQENATGDDQVTLALDSAFLKYEQTDPSTGNKFFSYIPQISLSIAGFRDAYYSASTVDDVSPDQLAQGGSVNFFGMFSQPLYPTFVDPPYIFAVSIALSVVSESVPQ